MPSPSTGRQLTADPSCSIEATSGVVVAAGAWGGDLLADSLGEEAWRTVLQPRKGHLLEVQPPLGQPGIMHGLMEMGYTSVRNSILLMGTLNSSSSLHVLIG